jgi:hypothetical protein
MKKFVILCLLFVSLCAMTGCSAFGSFFRGGVRSGGVIDYYGEYHFVLPFEHNVSYNQGDVLYFATDYLMEQMLNSINNAGYGATLHTNGDTETILISAEQEDFIYYFIIFDADYSVSGNGLYTLSNALSSMNPPFNYPFMAPLHIIEREHNYNARRRVFGSFDEIADFYRATGKNDAVIDEANKTIHFNNEGCQIFTPRQGIQFSAIRATIVLQFVESEDGNYLYIKRA